MQKQNLTYKRFELYNTFSFCVIISVHHILTSILMRTLGFQLPTIVMSDDESFVSVHCVAVMSTECKLSPHDWKAVTMEQGESLFHSVLQ